MNSMRQADVMYTTALSLYLVLEYQILTQIILENPLTSSISPSLFELWNFLDDSS